MFLQKLYVYRYLTSFKANEIPKIRYLRQIGMNYLHICVLSTLQYIHKKFTFGQFKEKLSQAAKRKTFKTQIIAE